MAGNVAIVESQDSTSLIPIAINTQDFLYHVGDVNQTVQLLPSEFYEELAWAQIKRLCGAWVESGDEDRQLEELYASRLLPSSLPDDEA